MVANPQLKSMRTRLQVEQLDIAVADRLLVSNLRLDIEAGSFVCILGTNGVGKTLTLHTLAGLRPGGSTAVKLCGDPLGALTRKAIARRLGLLLQIHEDAFPQTVLDLALMGRYPGMNYWQWTGAADRAAAIAALRSFDLEGLEQRLVTTLSGGERERAALATLLVQDPQIWLLDEPMNHLDPHHQLDVFTQLKLLSRQGRIIVSTVHNPALAMRFADSVLLLYGAGEWEYGAAGELLEPERLERLYRTPFDYYTSVGTDGGEGRTLLMPA